MKIDGCTRGGGLLWPTVILMFALLLAFAPAAAAGSGSARVRHIADITRDYYGNSLQFPSMVFFDRFTSEIYIVTGGAGAVDVYDKKFFPVARVSRASAPRGLYVGKEGRVYICQGGAAGVRPSLAIYNGAYYLEKQIFFDTIRGYEKYVPTRVAVGRNGRMYVAGLNRSGVMVLDKEGAFLKKLAPVDYPFGKRNQEKKGEPKQVLIHDVITDSKGNIYILSEESSATYVYDADENFKYSFGEKGGVPGKLSRPRGVAIDEGRNRAYVVDYMRHTILAYDLASSEFLFETGGLGRGPGWFTGPSAIAINDQGQLLVADLFNQRVQVLEVME